MMGTLYLQFLYINNVYCYYLFVIICFRFYQINLKTWTVMLTDFTTNRENPNVILNHIMIVTTNMPLFIHIYSVCAQTAQYRSSDVAYEWIYVHEWSKLMISSICFKLRKNSRCINTNEIIIHYHFVLIKSF